MSLFETIKNLFSDVTQGNLDVVDSVTNGLPDIGQTIEDVSGGLGDQIMQTKEDIANSATDLLQK